MRNEFKSLVGCENNIIGLSNELQELGCEDICEYGNWSEILENGSVVIATDECGDNHIQIFFNIVATAGENEVVEATEIKITNVEEY